MCKNERRKSDNVACFAVMIDDDKSSYYHGNPPKIIDIAPPSFDVDAE